MDIQVIGPTKTAKEFVYPLSVGTVFGNPIVPGATYMRIPFGAINLRTGDVVKLDDFLDSPPCSLVVYSKVKLTVEV